MTMTTTELEGASECRYESSGWSQEATRHIVDDLLYRAPRQVGHCGSPSGQSPKEPENFTASASLTTLRALQVTVAASTAGVVTFASSEGRHGYFVGCFGFDQHGSTIECAASTRQARQGVRKKNHVC
jgi:hypothetical protein